MAAQGILNPAEVERLVAEHEARKADHGRKLWAILSFQLWHDRFIGNAPLADWE